MVNWKSIGRHLWSSGFVRHALTLGGGNAAAQVIMVAASPVLAWLYSPAAFGVFAIYTALMAVVAIVATLSYEQAVMLPRRHRQAACLLLFMLMLSPSVGFGLGLPLALLGQPVTAMVDMGSLAPWLWLLPISITLFGWYQALRYWSMRREAFADVARNAVLRTTVGMGLACLMGLYPPFPEAPAAGLILSQIIGEGLGNFLLASRIYRRDRALIAWPGLRRVLAIASRWRSLALPLAAGDAVAMCYSRLPVLAIASLFGPSATGLYAWAERFTVLPSQLVAAAIGDVFRQRATVEFHKNGRFDRLMRNTFAVTTILALPPYLIGMAVAPALFGWIFGQEWYQAGEFAQILLVGGLVAFVTTPVDKATVIFQRTNFILAWHVSRLALKLAAVGAVVWFDWQLTMLLWLIVLTRITLYSVDLGYCYHLARGVRLTVPLHQTALESAHK